MAQTTKPNLGLAYYADGDVGWGASMRSNMSTLDAWCQCSVINMTTTAPPGSPTSGDRYIIAATATGAWTGKENQLAVYFGGAWEYYTPAAGRRVDNQADGQQYRYTGTAWRGQQSFLGHAESGETVRLQFTDADIDHDMEFWSFEQNTWFDISIASSTVGGAVITGLTDANTITPLNFWGITGASSTSRAGVMFSASKRDGGNDPGPIDASEILAMFENTDWENLGTGNNKRVWIYGNGQLVAGAPTTALADGSHNASTWSVHVNEGSNLLTFKVKYSDGTTVKSGTVALS